MRSNRAPDARLPRPDWQQLAHGFAGQRRRCCAAKVQLNEQWAGPGIAGIDPPPQELVRSAIGGGLGTFAPPLGVAAVGLASDQ